jgi:hypothetical protein
MTHRWLSRVAGFDTAKYAYSTTAARIETNSNHQTPVVCGFDTPFTKSVQGYSTTASFEVSGEILP